MGFFEELGGLACGIAGGVVGGAVGIAGELTDSKLLKDIGKGTYEVSKLSGKRVGKFADGTIKCLSGLINEDSQKANEGFETMADTASQTAIGIGKGVVNIAGKSLETVGAILDGDKEKTIEVGKELVKTLAVGALAIGVIDIIDGLDGLDGPDFDTHEPNSFLLENSETHHVTPHYRTLDNGSTIWVDGDGDTSIDSFDGWEQTNPDFRA